MDDLYFEGRRLQRYGEYVLSDDLVLERVYFKLGYLDNDMMLPQMYPVVFIGRDLDARLPGLYFQDAESWLDGTRATLEHYAVLADHGSSDTEQLPDGQSLEGDDFHLEWEKPRKYSGVHEFEGALNGLLGCSLRRKRWDGVARRSVHEDES